jgi:hypothetical protein
LPNLANPAEENSVHDYLVTRVKATY